MWSYFSIILSFNNSNALFGRVGLELVKYVHAVVLNQCGNTPGHKMMINTPTQSKLTITLTPP